MQKTPDVERRLLSLIALIEWTAILLAMMTIATELLEVTPAVPRNWAMANMGAVVVANGTRLTLARLWSGDGGLASAKPLDALGTDLMLQGSLTLCWIYWECIIYASSQQPIAIRHAAILLWWILLVLTVQSMEAGRLLPEVRHAHTLRNRERGAIEEDLPLVV